MQQIIKHITVLDIMSIKSSRYIVIKVKKKLM